MVRGDLLATRRQGRTHLDEGFGLVEVLVAVLLMAIVLLVVTRGTLAALSASAFGKEHSVATSLIAGDIAQLQALPFGDVESGLNPAADPLSSDPNIVRSGSTYALNSTYNPTGATLATANASTSEPPLVPHVTTVPVGTVSYEVATYPTTSTAEPGLVTTIVIVSWASPTGGRSQVVGETQIGSP